MAANDIGAINARLPAIDERFSAMVTREQWQGIRDEDRAAVRQLQDEWRAGRETDRAEARRLFLVQHEEYRDQIRLLAEGHAMLAEGQERIIERIDRLEREMTTRFIAVQQALERKRDKPQYKRSRG